MPPQPISSSSTAIEKFVFPVIMLLGTDALAAWLYLPHLLPDWLPPPPALNWLPSQIAPLMVHILFWAIWACLVFLVCWNAVVIKRVRTDWQNLYVSDYRKEITIPIAAVVEVRENRWFALDPAAIVLDEDTQWGRVIRFAAPGNPDENKLRIGDWLATWTSPPHPLLEEIRTVARTARMGRGLVRIHQAAQTLGRPGWR